jgi:hypothetical protein
VTRETQLANLKNWRQRLVQIGAAGTLAFIGSAHSSAAGELWHSDRWIVSATEPGSEEEISACILQPRFSLSEFKFVWEPGHQVASVRLDLSFNPMDAAEYERNDHILVQFDQDTPLNLQGSIDGGEIYYEGSIQNPQAFFKVAANATTMALGSENMGFVIHNMQGSADAISAFQTCAASHYDTQISAQDYWHYVADSRMLYTCNNLDGEYAPERNASSQACVAFACDYKSPTLTIFVRNHMKPVTLETIGFRKRVAASNTEEEKSLARVFGMSAKVIVLDGTAALRDQVGRDWTIMTEKQSFRFRAPKVGESAEGAFAKFSKDCL